MMLTEIEKQLIHGLTLFGCDAVVTLAISMRLQTEESQEAMIDWMIEHRDASPVQLSEQSSKIARLMCEWIEEDLELERS